MAAAAGEKSTTSQSCIMETYGFEELSTMATQYWAGRSERACRSSNV